LVRRNHRTIGRAFSTPDRSWLNLVVVWIGIIERQALRCGTFTSVRDLMIKIRACINGWNPRATRSSGPEPLTRS